MNIIKGTVAGTLLATLSATGAWADSSDPIKIPINEWTGQHISAHITGSLLQKAGYSIEYVTAGAVPQFAAIAQGDLHVQPETWTNNVGDIYPKAVESGDIVVLGSLGLKPQEGWIYPPYMNDKCPGLPSYEALYDCAQAFAAADTFPKGRLITYPGGLGHALEGRGRHDRAPVRAGRRRLRGRHDRRAEERGRGRAADHHDVLAAALDPRGDHIRLGELGCGRGRVRRGSRARSAAPPAASSRRRSTRS